MSGAVHTAARADSLSAMSDELAGILAAEIESFLLRRGAGRSRRSPSARPRPRTSFTGPRASMSSLSISAARFDMFLRILSCTSRLRAAQRDSEGIRADVAQQRLDAAVVDVEQVVEDEQQVLDLLMHLGVRLLDLAELLAALIPSMELRMLATVRAPPIWRSGDGGGAFACFSTSWSSSVERGLRHFVERGDAHQHVGAHALGEQRQDRWPIARLRDATARWRRSADARR